MIKANCRARFTAADFEFVVRTLSRSGRDAVSLVELLTDEEMRDSILDHERILHAIIEDGNRLSISPQFYFYVLARHVLKSAGLECRTMCDYIAGVLESCSRSARMLARDEAVGRSTPYLSDMLLALRTASPNQAFLIRADVGDFSLFISGIFHENVRKRSVRGAPDLSFYEEVGSSSYRQASDHRIARAAELSTVYRDLASSFHCVRKALNRLSDEFIHLGDDPHTPLLPEAAA